MLVCISLSPVDAFPQTKTYYMADNDQPVLKKAVGTPISWTPGKDPTKKVLR